MARFKKEFRDRLIALKSSIDKALESDSEGDVKPGNLFPNLFKVYSYIWNIDKVYKE